MLLLAFMPAVHAFCGTYVGQAGAELLNGASQIAVVRQGHHTTLTLANAYQGDATEFALVVPVPQVLGPDDVTVADPELFGRLDAYSAPRLVRYTCDDFARSEDDLDADGGDTGAAMEEGPPADESVTVEASFAAGEYDIAILSADESGALVTWLDANGYAVSANAETLLGEYIEGGSYFFAARVALDRLPEGASYLSPLQFGYDSEVFSLPVRLGTLNSPGEQDLVLYVVNDFDSGRVGISNYPEVAVENECMFDGTATFADFYQERFTTALTSQPRPGWVSEYQWGNGHCDPCTGEPPSDEDLTGLGYAGLEESGDTGGGGYYFFTRLHMRYGPVGVDQDLVLYPSNDPTQAQIRYIQYDAALEDRFPRCVAGWSDDPGSCDDVDGDDERDDTNDDARGGEERVRGGCGCGTPLSPAIGLSVVATMLVRRRRRS